MAFTVGFSLQRIVALNGIEERKAVLAGSLHNASDLFGYSLGETWCLRGFVAKYLSYF
jgi:hypothetical protein